MATVDIDLLRTFVTVVETGGFAQAAERLFRGQSAVSLQIKRLEEAVGLQLLDRSPRHLNVTRDGEMMLDYARRILGLNDEMLARMREPEIAGLVRFGAPEDFATAYLPRILSRFASSYPDVRLEVTCELTLPLLERFQGGNLDLALVKREPGSGIKGPGVWREPLVWAAAGHTLVEDDRPLPLAVSPRPCVYRKRGIDALEAANRPWHVAYTCASLAGTLAAVRAGLGVTVLPKELVPTDLNVLDGDAVGLPVLQDTEMALIQASQLNAAAQRLRDHIVRDLEHRSEG